MSQEEVKAARMKVNEETLKLDHALNRLADTVNDTIDLFRHPQATLKQLFHLDALKNHPVRAWTFLFLGGLTLGVLLGKQSTET